MFACFNFLSKFDFCDMNLTIYIDKDGGVDLNGCELVHRTIDPILDEIDPTCGEKFYYFVFVYYI